MTFKKWMLVLGSALVLQSPAANATLGEAAFECVFFTCPVILARVTGISWIIEMKGRREESKKILAAGDDAAFFKAHVMETQPGESSADFYSKMVIRIAPTDVLTQQVQVTHYSADKTSYYYQTEDAPLVVDQSQPILLDNTKINGVKINGRLLISEKLEQAHKAVQFLIYSDAIKVETATRTEFQVSKDALALNEIVLKSAQQK